jgi:hypothetical protein
LKFHSFRCIAPANLAMPEVETNERKAEPRDLRDIRQYDEAHRHSYVSECFLQDRKMGRLYFPEEQNQA